MVPPAASSTNSHEAGAAGGITSAPIVSGDMKASASRNDRVNWRTDGRYKVDSLFKINASCVLVRVYFFHSQIVSL